MSSLNVFFFHKTTISFSLVASKLILVMMHKPSKTNVSHTAYSIIQLALKSPEKKLTGSHIMRSTGHYRTYCTYSIKCRGIY